MTARAVVPAKSEECGFMDFPQIWPHLSTSSRSWLIDHNCEPLPNDLITEIFGCGLDHSHREPLSSFVDESRDIAQLVGTNARH